MQMRCAWNALLGILPQWIRQQISGQDTLQEIRLRTGLPPELIASDGNRLLMGTAAAEDLNYCVNMASGYSPWTAESISEGYLTAPGGHRIGLCGQAVMREGKLAGIRNLTSLCIRVARDVPGAAEGAEKFSGNLLILGIPGSGKTTLLRDLIRTFSDLGPASVTAVDERGELFPVMNGKPCFPAGMRTDILTGCPKAEGIEMALRTMGPGMIAVDEITAERDCTALTRAGWCGVRLLATAHASSVSDLKSRNLYRKLYESGLFSCAIVMQPDKTWKMERLGNDR